MNKIRGIVYIILGTGILAMAFLHRLGDRTNLAYIMGPLAILFGLWRLLQKPAPRS